MVKIDKAGLVVTWDLFLSAFEAYKKAGLNNREAFEAAETYFDVEGYKIGYSSFESFRTAWHRSLRTKR
jgi:hypothetical protein